VARKIKQHLIDLCSRPLKIPLVVHLHRLHQQRVDGVGGRSLELRQHVVEINLRRPRRELLMEILGRCVSGVKSEHELQPNEGFLSISLLEFAHHLFEGGHHTILCLGRELGVAGIRHDNDVIRGFRKGSTVTRSEGIRLQW
jgi:hypothetical protein